MTIVAKLGNMRKAQEWTVYPKSSAQVGKQDIVIQSDTRIAQINQETKTAVLSQPHKNGSYFLDLLQLRGAMFDVPVPQEVIDAALAAQPKSGDEVGPGVTIA